MSSAIDREEGLSSSERDNLDVLAEVRAQAQAEASTVQVAIEKISSFFGSPAYLGFSALFILVWMGLNIIGSGLGWAHVDTPPFFYLQGIVSAHALLLTIAVLIRQNRMSELAEQRAHLDLQINLLTEQKVTKLLQATQSQGQRGGPHSPNGQSDDLAKPADPHAILSAIKRQHEQH